MSTAIQIPTSPHLKAISFKKGLDELERNKEAFKIIQSIHVAETTPIKHTYLKYLSFKHVGSIHNSELAVISLKLLYTSTLIYAANLLTVLLNFHILTILTIIPCLLLLILAPLISFWCVHFQLIRFTLLNSRLSAFAALTGLLVQSLIWFLMSLGFVSGASGGVFALISHFYSKNWLLFSFSLINFIILSISLTIAINLKQKLIKVLLL